MFSTLKMHIPNQVALRKKYQDRAFNLCDQSGGLLPAEEIGREEDP